MSGSSPWGACSRRARAASRRRSAIRRSCLEERTLPATASAQACSRMRAGIVLGQRQHPPHAALAHTALGVEQALAQRQGMGTNGLGLRQQIARLARRIERALVLGQHQRSRARGPCMRAQQRLRVEIADLDRVLVDAHQHAAADGGWTRGVAAVVHPHRGVVPDGADHLGEGAKRLHRQAGAGAASPPGTSPHLALGAAVDAQRRPLLLPVHEELVVLLQGLEATAA